MCGCQWILSQFTTGLHSCIYVHVHFLCNSLSLSSYHLPVPFDLDPLVDSLVPCQWLTSLGLACSTLSLQSLLTVMQRLHNLRALGLKSVSLSDERVSDWVWTAWTVDNQLQHLKYSTWHTIVLSCLTVTHCLRCSPHCIISGTPSQSEGVDYWRTRVQWVPCQGSSGGDGKETWCGKTGCYSSIQGGWVSLVHLSFHGQAVQNDVPQNMLYTLTHTSSVLCQPLYREREEMSAETVL